MEATELAERGEDLTVKLLKLIGLSEARGKVPLEALAEPTS